MTPADVAKVLAKAAAFDQRTVGEADVMAWHEVIGDLDLADALAAVTRHHTESTDRLMPVHIRRHAEAIAHDRQRALRESEERRALEAYAAEAGPLTDRRPEIQAFVAHMRTVLPEGSDEALRPRTKHWEREHRHWQRQQEAEPNPHYDPTTHDPRPGRRRPRRPRTAPAGSTMTRYIPDPTAADIPRRHVHPGAAP